MKRSSPRKLPCWPSDWISVTPEHDCWLKVSEIERSALSRQSRIDNLEVPETEPAAWEADVNADQRQVQWHFITDARIKLRYLFSKHER